MAHTPSFERQRAIRWAQLPRVNSWVPVLRVSRRINIMASQFHRFRRLLKKRPDITCSPWRPLRGSQSELRTPLVTRRERAPTRSTRRERAPPRRDVNVLPQDAT